MAFDEHKYRDIRKRILKRLISLGKWGGNHTHFKNMFQVVPKHERGLKETKQAIRDLIKENKIIPKQTIQEPHVSLNPQKSKEIKDELEN